MTSPLDLELNGWRQGSLVRRTDRELILEGVAIEASELAELVVISQSCDIAQPESAEPFVEILIAEPLANKDGNYTFNKNPRILHTTLLTRTESIEVQGSTDLKLIATNKILAPKSRFLGLSPDPDKAFSLSDLHALCGWLAARYTRPALPSAFNRAIDDIDAGTKNRKRLAKKISRHISGIYVEIIPDREIRSHEKYRVNLLGLMVPDSEVYRTDVKGEIAELGRLLEKAGMDVTAAVRSEDEISVAHLRPFKRLYLDDISYRDRSPLPHEIDSTSTGK